MLNPFDPIQSSGAVIKPAIEADYLIFTFQFLHAIWTPGNLLFHHGTVGSPLFIIVRLWFFRFFLSRRRFWRIGRFPFGCLGPLGGLCGKDLFTSFAPQLGPKTFCLDAKLFLAKRASDHSHSFGHVVIPNQARVHHPPPGSGPENRDGPQANGLYFYLPVFIRQMNRKSYQVNLCNESG